MMKRLFCLFFLVAGMAPALTGCPSEQLATKTDGRCVQHGCHWQLDSNRGKPVDYRKPAAVTTEPAKDKARAAGPAWPEPLDTEQKP